MDKHAFIWNNTISRTRTVKKKNGVLIQEPYIVPLLLMCNFARGSSGPRFITIRSPTCAEWQLVDWRPGHTQTSQLPVASSCVVCCTSVCGPYYCWHTWGPGFQSWPWRSRFVQVTQVFVIVIQNIRRENRNAHHKRLSLETHETWGADERIILKIILENCDENRVNGFNWLS